METAIVQTAPTAEDQQLILNPKRDALMMRLNSFKTDNLTAKDRTIYDDLNKKAMYMFRWLAWSKFGISLKQIKELDRNELNELAAMIYERSKTPAMIQRFILTCIPVLGWSVFAVTMETFDTTSNDAESAFYKNMRYYFWSRRIKKLFGKNYSPDLAWLQEEK